MAGRPLPMEIAFARARSVKFDYRFFSPHHVLGIPVPLKLPESGIKHDVTACPLKGSRSEAWANSSMRSESSPLSNRQLRLSGIPHAIEVLLTSKEASQVLKIHPKVLERMAKRGEVPALKVGRFWRYRATTLDAWINSRLQSGRQPCRMETSS